ncbi:MAG: ABC transporter permease [Firmicutes bacterium]|nr:ABC transporter permease [Bacillota bacterium]
MIKLLRQRLQRALLVILGVSLFSFMIVHLTGDPAILMLPPDATVEQVEQFREAVGFNDPLWQQYLRWLTNAVRGDFGFSLRHQQPALTLILERMPATIELTLAALAVSLLVGIPLGVWTASKRNTFAASIGSIFGLLGQSLPAFWMALMLQLFFGLIVPIFPLTGRGSFSQLVMPAITLGMYTTATIMRLLQAHMVEVLQQDYIRTARSKGLSQALVVFKHALRNALLPVVTIIGLQLGTLLGGAVITESIFAWPGVGRLLVQAINNRDIPLVQAGVFVLAVCIVIINLCTDVLYTWLDPRIRLES